MISSELIKSKTIIKSVLESNINEVESIIDSLRNIDVDGETMQYIIEKVGMSDQMLRQLVMSFPQSDTKDLLEEKVELDNQRLSAKNRFDATPERRLQFIKEDIASIFTIIHDNDPKILKLDSHPECEIGTLLNNINIACDLNDDEPNSWRVNGEDKKFHG